MTLLIKNFDGMRRAAYVTEEAAAAAVGAGEAMPSGYPDIIEEISEGERAQGYMTRSMYPIAPAVAVDVAPVKAKPPKKPAAPVEAPVAPIDSEGGEPV